MCGEHDSRQQIKYAANILQTFREYAMNMHLNMEIIYGANIQRSSCDYSAKILIKSKNSCCNYVANNNCEYSVNTQQSVIYKSQNLLNLKIVKIYPFCTDLSKQHHSRTIKRYQLKHHRNRKTHEKRLHTVKRLLYMLSFLHHGNYDSHLIEEFNGR